MSNYNVSALGVNIIKNKVLGLFTKNIKFVFPKKIGSFVFDSEISNDSDGGISVAIYKNGNNIPVIAKFWSGNLKNFAYYSLINELNVYTALTQTIKSTRSRLPSKYKSVSIPKLISFREEANYSVLMIEYIKGVTILNKSKDVAVNSYILVSKYLTYLGSHIDVRDKSKITSRTNLYYILMFPLFSIYAILNNPKYFSLISKASYEYAKYIPNIINIKHLKLTHRDLNLGNILVHKNKSIVIDFQMCAYSIEESELANTLGELWSINKNQIYFYEKVTRGLNYTKENFNILKPMMIFVAIQGLCARNFSIQIMDGFKDFLNFSLNI